MDAPSLSPPTSPLGQSDPDTLSLKRKWLNVVIVNSPSRTVDIRRVLTEPLPMPIKFAASAGGYSASLGDPFPMARESTATTGGYRVSNGRGIEGRWV